jgi:dTDP-4-dehydrorhamnose reductase
MKLLLLGSQGQLGQAFQALSQTPAFPIGWELMSWKREQGDLSDPQRLVELIGKLKPDAIINAAAYTQVDLAEQEIDLCERINTESPAALAAYARTTKIPLIHFSTDYVYGGASSEPHLETEKLHPENQYGRSKALGDEAILISGCDHLIFRTSWVYSFVGKNFVKTMLRLAETKTELNVVNDQIGSPTYAPDLAEISLEALMRSLEKQASGQAFPSGVYHLTNSGFTSWADFAKAIIPQIKISGIATSEYPTPAKRPLNSRLSLTKIGTAFGLKPRPWQQALTDCLKKLGKSHA